MYVNVLIQKMIMLCIPIAIGYICRKKDIFHERANIAFSKLMTEVTMPCLIFYSIACQEAIGSKLYSLNILAIGSICFIILILAATFTDKLYGAKKEEKGIIKFITVFNNCTFMGLPILNAVLGNIGTFYIAIFNIVNNIMVFTIGLYYIGLSANKMGKFTLKLLINTGNIATILGLIFYYLDIKPFIVIQDTTSMIGNMTTPLSMIVLGVSLAEMNVLDIIKSYKLYIFALIKMIAFPLFIFILLRFTGIADKNLILGFTLISAMPGASVTVTLANQYDANPHLASKYMLLSTIISIITIPTVVYIVSLIS